MLEGMATQLPEDLLYPHNLKIFHNINLFSCNYILNVFPLTTL